MTKVFIGGSRKVTTLNVAVRRRLDTIIEKIEAVTADEILDLANELFNRDQMTLTLLGPVQEEKEKFEAILYQN